ncbi:MAG: CIA30 family protein [Woeseiaceae bacterium]|nr:CIA30 family protein [Woeseiaceae bacterium]
MHAKTALGALAVSVALIVALVILLPEPEVVETVSGRTTVVNNVRIFDGSSLLTAGRLVMRDGKVLASDAAIPSTAVVVDGTGLIALPGLIDAHTHTYGRARRDALRFGVTTMVDMFTSPLQFQDRDDRAGFAETNEAALFSAGILATAEGGHGTQFGVPVETLAKPSDAAQWVADRKAEGSDFIKLVYMSGNPMFPSLDLATTTAVIDEAKAQGLLVVAHIARHSDAFDLVEAGIDGFVHVFADREISDDLLQKMIDRDVFVIPTLAVIAMIDGKGPGLSVLDDPRLSEYLTPSQRSGLAGSFGRPIPGFVLKNAMHNVGVLHAAGVRILAGSDAPNPGTAHGATLHQELELLVESGLTPLEALQSATASVADSFNLDGRGNLLPGSRADVVLVGSDSLGDIHETRRIHSIYRNGYRVDRDTATPVASEGVGLPAVLGRFEEGISAPEGFTWQPTSDEMMGGASAASVDHIRGGADGTIGALVVDATIKPGFPFPWAGAFFGGNDPANAASLGDYQGISFDIRGTPSTYRMMLFSTETVGAPPTEEFSVTSDWQRVTLPLDGLTGSQRDQFVGLAFVTPMTPGQYQFLIDNVTLLETVTGD